MIQTQKIEPLLYELAKENAGVLTFEQLELIAKDHNITFKATLDSLLVVASKFAIAPVSNFLVGAIVVDDNSKTLYLGANLEFKGQALSLVVHAEQAAINNAWMNGARSVSQIHINAAPCGYCRQFMNELSTADDLIIHLPNGKTSLSELLPNAFGPKDLGNVESLFSQIDTSAEDTLKSHLSLSYAPYSHNQCAALIELEDGTSVFGRYAENAAYSPSLSPLQAALSQLALKGMSLDTCQIKRVKLMQSKGVANQKEVAIAVLESYGLADKLEVEEV